MNAGEICSREVFIVRAEEPLRDAVVLMHKHRVGAIVVVEQRGAMVRPIGIVTDRDVVCQLWQLGDLHGLRVEDAMTPRPTTVSANASLHEAIRLMSECGVRRAPVVNGPGDLVGILSLDDLLPAIAEELLGIARLMDAQTRAPPPGCGAPASLL